MKFPQGKALTNAVWGLFAIAAFVWLIVDAGLWDEIPLFFKIVAVVLGTYEAYTIANKDQEDTLSEGIWRIIPDRPIVGFVFGILTLYLFKTISVRDIWWFLMSHFVFSPKPPNDDELFKLALQRYNKLKRTVKKYDEFEKEGGL